VVEALHSAISRLMDKNVSQCGGFKCRVAVRLVTLRHLVGGYTGLEKLWGRMGLPLTDAAMQLFEQDDAEAERHAAHHKDLAVKADRGKKRKLDANDKQVSRKVIEALGSKGLASLPDTFDDVAQLNDLWKKHEQTKEELDTRHKKARVDGNKAAEQLQVDDMQESEYGNENSDSGVASVSVASCIRHKGKGCVARFKGRRGMLKQSKGKGKQCTQREVLQPLTKQMLSYRRKKLDTLEQQIDVLKERVRDKNAVRPDTARQAVVEIRLRKSNDSNRNSTDSEYYGNGAADSIEYAIT
jgi:hypothetical protein